MDDTATRTAALTFVGTATTLIELGSLTLLTDPNFLHRGQRAYLGKGLWSRRLTEPALGVDELPPYDALLLSHLHGDHFDRVARRGLPREAPVVTTGPAARRLRSWGFTTRALEPWEDTVVDGPPGSGESVRVVAVPAVHARGVMGRLLPPVIGTVLEHRVGDEVRHRVYVTGDTLTGPHLDEVHARFPDLDTAVVHLGGTRVLLHTVTMDDVQGVDALRRVRPRRALPVHHSDYGVFASPLEDFLDRARDAGLDGVRAVAPGERVDLME
ncbi:MBL fold metallo-hydrolase [Lapillicoccus jejuensis]|uniref:L-ascorbate metabolism protein UlaG (Beta-lactamase superfamily) n=1 Tax=Lapillicoccus jejuensis TaxID=402171 RepID=A0A542E4F9_9MICO|nr:MBL fold metallo-hydrolase [Lapillicoccus jejuensis]TQJ10238.1 L-ascorbate metabolism protein UlaG (beta-lactamase superfamily) [Lapillicoccus jejuensis]